MKMSMTKLLALTLVCVFMLAACSGGGTSTANSPAASGSSDAGSTAPPASSGEEPASPADEEPIKFTMTYSDNPTFPFKEDWMPINKVQELFNADINFQVYPITEYNSKVTLSLNTSNPPDVMMRVDASISPYSEFATNGSFVAISDYFEYTPNLVKLLESNGLMDQLGNVSAKDGKLYHFPRITDKPIYNGGLLIRTDLLERYSLERPTTYDELYEVAKVFKQNYPNSYPITAYVELAELYDKTMPSFGLEMGRKANHGSYVLSYDYDAGEYFAGATSEKFKEYVRYFNKLHTEGLLDPEFTNNPSDQWTTKLATGISMITWSAYDQIGGLEANATEEGTKFDLLVPLQGPVAARCEAKPQLGDGIAIASHVADRPDFERFMRTVDNLFYSDEAIWLFSRGAEGETYEMANGQFKFLDKWLNDPNGLFKALQMNYGIGIYNFQMLWERDFELTKKDENYTVINDAATAMDAMPPAPPLPKFDADDAEEVALKVATLSDAFNVWSVDFITGAKSIDNDWDTYVAEMESKGINELLELFKANLL